MSPPLHQALLDGVALLRRLTLELSRAIGGLFEPDDVAAIVSAQSQRVGLRRRFDLLPADGADLAEKWNGDRRQPRQLTTTFRRFSGGRFCTRFVPVGGFQP